MTEESPITPRSRRLAGIVRWVLVGGFAVLAVVGAVIGAGLLSGGEVVKYACPMHAQVVQDGPGSCPICGMDLVPQAPGAGTEGTNEGATARGGVHVSDSHVSALGVVSVAAHAQALTRHIHAPGRVDADANAISVVDVRMPGWLSGLTVRSVGQHVRRGAVLATLTSPQLFEAENELVAARRSSLALGEAGAPLLESARARLASLGVPAGEVMRVSSGGAASTRLAVRAPRDGVVVALAASDGAYVGPGSALFTIADLSRVAVIAELSESDASALAVGDEVQISLPGAPAARLVGHLTLMAPSIDSARRTRNVRIAVDTVDAALVPGAAAWVDANLAPRNALVVPRDAVLSRADGARVFVDVGQGHFEPREVTLGIALDETVEIVTGLRDGERVASVGAFLLDAESRLRAGAP